LATLLELAVKAGCDSVVTYNTRDFAGIEQFGLRAITPAESTLTVQLPESLYKSLQKLAEQDGISLDQFVTLAIAEKISALTTESYLEERAARGSRAKYEAVLAKVPDAEPEALDTLPST